MKRDLGKWIVVVVMVCCFVMIFVLSTSKTNTSQEKPKNTEIPESANIKHKQRTILLENENLVLRNTQDDIIYIEGEGKLSQNDFSALLNYHGIIEDEITHLIIGDNITEIGYKAITGLNYLTTLKIGSGVIRISNGAIRELPILKYLYLPNTVQRVGPDFLYKCDVTSIVTNGKEEDLPYIGNLNTKRIISMVDSYERLILLTNNQLYMTIPPTKLSVSNDKKITDKVSISKDEMQFGPYISLNVGKYQIKYLGNSMNNINKDSIDACFNGGIKLSLQDIIINQNTITYTIELTEDLNNIEFRIRNTSDQTVSIEGIEIYQEKEEILPKTIKEWW